MRSTSAALFTRRAARMTASPSASCAFGNVAVNSCSNSGVRPSTPIRCAPDTPGMAATAPMMSAGFQLIGYKRSGGISAGTPKSVTLSRWTAPVSRTTTQPGANGRVPGEPEARRLGHEPGIAFTPEHEHVDVPPRHLVEREGESLSHAVPRRARSAARTRRR